MNESLIGLGLLLSSFVVTKLLQSRKVTVSEIWIYPIKSCKGYKVSSARTCKRGFEYDRAFMLIDGKGKFVSQRSFSRMALITVKVKENEGIMTVDAPNMPTLEVPLTKTQTNIEVVGTVWGQECQCIQVLTDAGNKWFADFLGVQEIRLVKMKDDFVRHTDEKYAPKGQASFADGFPFLLSSEESLNELNSKLDNQITIERFRPNIIVKGVRPFGEDHWTAVKFGNQNAIFNIVKPCSRCQVPNIDPTTAIPDVDSQPSKTMKSFRTGEAIGYENKKWSGALFFGQNVDHESREGVVVSVGDEVHVLPGEHKFLS